MSKHIMPIAAHVRKTVAMETNANNVIQSSQSDTPYEFR